MQKSNIIFLFIRAVRYPHMDAEKKFLETGDKFNAVFNRLISDARVSVTELHRNTRIPISTIQRLKNDKNVNPTINTLVPIADFFGVTVAQLIGEMPLPSVPSTPRMCHSNSSYWINVPIISWEQIVHWQSLQPDEIVEYTKTDMELSGQAFAIVMTDDDYRSFPKGCLLIVDTARVPKNNNSVLVKKADASFPSIRKIKIFEDETSLESLNSQGSTVPLTEEYEIIGVIVQIRFNPL